LGETVENGETPDKWVISVVQNILASILFAVGQAGVEGIRRSDWQRGLRAACEVAMERAVREASPELSDEGVSEAAYAFNVALGKLGNSRELAEDLGKSLIENTSEALLRGRLEAALGSDAEDLAAQGIDLETVIRVFPAVTLEELRGRFEPASRPFLMMQLSEVARRLRHIEELTELMSSVMIRIASAMEVSEFQAKGLRVEIKIQADPESDLSRAIIAAEASILSAKTQGEIEDAAAKVQRLVSKVQPGVYWQPLRASDQTVVLDHVIQLILNRRPDLERLAMDQARLRAKTGKSRLALNDYLRIAGRFGENRPEALLQAATILMTNGDYAESTALLRRATAEGLEPVAFISAAHVQSWIDDYQGRHLDTIRKSNELLMMAQRMGESRHMYGIRHRLARATLALATKESDADLMDLALHEFKRAEEYNYEENPFNAFWTSRASRALRALDLKTVWGDAQERMSVLGDGGLAHIRLDEGRAALEEKRHKAALTRLHQTEHVWKGSLYRKGLFDVAVALGEGYAGLRGTSDDHKRALAYFRLADRLGARMRLADRESVRRQLFRLLARSSVPVSRQLHEADERLEEMSFASVLSEMSASPLLVAVLDSPSSVDR
jgi:hypothetical protein